MAIPEDKLAQLGPRRLAGLAARLTSLESEMEGVHERVQKAEALMWGVAWSRGRAEEHLGDRHRKIWEQESTEAESPGQGGRG